MLRWTSFLVDSSASFCLERQLQHHNGQHTFVESGTFQRAKGFLEFLVEKLDMPEVQVGLIRFEDKSETICPLTSKREDILESIHAMEPMAGETKLAPPLVQAGKMLSKAGEDVPERLVMGSSRYFPVTKAVLIITDGEPPYDREETKAATQELESRGVKLLFLKITQNRSGVVPTDYLRSLASPFDRCRPMSEQAAKRNLPGLFESRDDEQALQEVAPYIFQQMLTVTRRITRASCLVPASPYMEVVGDLDGIGLDVRLPDGEIITDPEVVAWDRIMWQQEKLDEDQSLAEKHSRLRMKVTLAASSLECAQTSAAEQQASQISERLQEGTGGTHGSTSSIITTAAHDCTSQLPPLPQVGTVMTSSLPRIVCRSTYVSTNAASAVSVNANGESALGENHLEMWKRALSQKAYLNSWGQPVLVAQQSVSSGIYFNFRFRDGSVVTIYEDASTKMLEVSDIQRSEHAPQARGSLDAGLWSARQLQASDLSSHSNLNSWDAQAASPSRTTQCYGTAQMKAKDTMSPIKQVDFIAGGDSPHESMQEPEVEASATPARPTHTTMTVRMVPRTLPPLEPAQDSLNM